MKGVVLVARYSNGMSYEILSHAYVHIISLLK